MDDTPLEENINVSRKPYVPPTLVDMDFTPDTQGKPTSYSEIGTFAGAS